MCSSESGTPPSIELPPYLILNAAPVEASFRELESEQPEVQVDRAEMVREILECLKSDRQARFEMQLRSVGILDRIPEEYEDQFSLELRCFKLIGELLHQLLHIHRLYRKDLLNYTFHSLRGTGVIMVRDDVRLRELRDEFARPARY